MKIGTTSIEIDDRADALGDRVLAEGRPDVLLLERLGVQARGQAARLEDRDQVVDLLGREPLAATSMIPWSRISRVDRRGRLHHAVEEDRQLILEGAVLLGQVLAGRAGRTCAPPCG